MIIDFEQYKREHAPEAMQSAQELEALEGLNSAFSNFLGTFSTNGMMMDIHTRVGERFSRLQLMEIISERASDAIAKAGFDPDRFRIDAARLEAEALPLVKQTTDEIAAQYAAGIDFKTLISRYSTDKTERNVNGDGYPFHPDSKMWPESFIKAASALEKVGDISQPFVTEQGVHILCYVGEVPAGAHVLTDEERELLNAAALRYYQKEKLNDLIDGWQADYEIETHPELLKY